MAEEAREAEKKRRRAEALRANLRRRKAASGGRDTPPTERAPSWQNDDERDEAKASDGDTRGI